MSVGVDSYISERYQPQLAWYTTNAWVCRIGYWTFQSLVIIFSAVTSVLVAANYRWTPAILSVGVTVTSSLLSTFKFRECWISYRMTRELLEREHALYRHRRDAYTAAADADQLFIDRVEGILERAGQAWVGIFSPKDEALAAPGRSESSP
jgi:hypothetical protein